MYHYRDVVADRNQPTSSCLEYWFNFLFHEISCVMFNEKLKRNSFEFLLRLLLHCNVLIIFDLNTVNISLHTWNPKAIHKEQQYKTNYYKQKLDNQSNCHLAIIQKLMFKGFPYYTIWGLSKQKDKCYISIWLIEAYSIDLNLV